MWNHYQFSSSSNTSALGAFFLIFFFLKNISPRNYLLPSGIMSFPRTSAELGSGCSPHALRLCHRRCASMRWSLMWDELDTDSKGRSYLSLKLVNFCVYLKSFTSAIWCGKEWGSPGAFSFLVGTERLGCELDDGLISVNAEAGAGGAVFHTASSVTPNICLTLKRTQTISDLG